MKVLIISFRFAPFNSIGTNRIIELVKFFEKNNVEYRVITAFNKTSIYNDYSYNKDKIIHLPWFSLFDLKIIRENSIIDKNDKLILFKKVIAKFLRIIALPDVYYFWYKMSKKKALEIFYKFKPDIIYSSSYPFSSHLLANYIKKNSNVKWYAELRDPWINNHGFKSLTFNQVFAPFLSKRCFSKVDKLVTVSEVWQDEMIKNYSKETIVVRNGYINSESTGKSLGSSFYKNDKNYKHIIYTGLIFKDRQDINGFFKIFLRNNQNYKFVYAGKNFDLISNLAKHYGIENQIVNLRELTHEGSLKLQNKADYLLLLNWKGNKGVIPGKFYEYLNNPGKVLLWNNSINNEVFKLSNEINNHCSKITILNNSNVIIESEEIINQSFEYLKRFSRMNQFTILLKDFSGIKN